MRILIFCAFWATALAQDLGDLAERYYTPLIQKGQATAAAFAVLDHGEVAATRVFGAVREDSLWRVASVSKTFTALAILQLAEQKKLSLDSDVNDLLKSFKVPDRGGHPITIRHLLTHESGLDDQFVGSAFLESDGPQAPLARTMRDWLPRRIYDPDQLRLYTNFGYGLLGAVIEDVTGESFETYMQSAVLKPFGMIDSTFEQPLRSNSRQRLVAATERTVFARIQPAPVLYHRATSAGGLTSSLPDLLRFLRAVQERPNIQKEYGFGFGTNRGQKYISASGDLGGYHAVLLWFPEHQRALVTLATGPSVNLCWNLVPRAMDAWFGAEKQAPAVNLPAKQKAGIVRLARYPHHDLSKAFVLGWDRLSMPMESEHELESITWYESGAVAILTYFGFLIASLVLIWRRAKVEKSLYWVAWSVLIHSVAWVGAVLLADPQRLILGISWYLNAALALGLLVFLAWANLFAKAVRERRMLFATLAYAFYFPILWMWNVFPQ